jgi:hypothetical protein
MILPVHLIFGSLFFSQTTLELMSNPLSARY